MANASEKHPSYDVFLCHNSKDKDEVKRIARRLQEQHIRCWLDEWELPPGRPWLFLVQEQIECIQSAAVFVGGNDMGPWQKHEIEALLNQFVQRGCPIIPVLLDTVQSQPHLPPFLASMTWVDFRKQDPDPLQHLIWGIRQQKPGTSPDPYVADDPWYAARPHQGSWVHAIPASSPEQDIEKELDSSVVLVDLKKQKQASDGDIDQYYHGMPVGWNIILADADVVRDQQQELLQKYSEPVNATRILCLSGEPGAGKSTLAWRLAVEIVRKSKQLLIHIQNNEKEDVWYQLGKILSRHQLSAVIIVDDVFRADNPERALNAFAGNLNTSNLNVTILATTRSNEIPEDVRLPFCEYVQVKPPSKSEKERVIRKLRKENLSQEQKKRLTKADSWLVMMIELTDGESLKKIVWGSINKLKKDQANAHVYKAYEYLCYAGQYQLPIPKTLLGALDERGDDFYLLEEEPVGKGLIVYNKPAASYSTLHPLFAEEAFRACKRNPESILMKLTDAAEQDERTHRVFLCSLFFYSVKIKQEEACVRKILVKKAKKIDDILDASTPNELWHYWRGLYSLLHDDKQIARMEQRMLEKKPEAAQDWASYLKYINEKGSQDLEAATLEIAREWLKGHAEDQKALVVFLGLLEKGGREDLVMALIADMQQWLTTHESDDAVRAAYLELIENRGKVEQWNSAIAETRSWLQTHDTDQQVRAAYLELVGNRGDDWDRAIEDTTLWLQTHEADQQVRAAYLGLVESQGKEKHWKGVISDPRQRLRPYEDTAYVCKTYLDLMERQGEEEHWPQALADTARWLDAHKEDIQIRRIYLKLVERRGEEKLCKKALKDTREWLMAHEEDTLIRRSYLGLVERRGEEEQRQEAIEDTQAWLAIYKDEQVRVAYLELVGSRGKEHEVEAAIKETAQWLADHKDNVVVRTAYLTAVARRGTLEQRKEAILTTTHWIETHASEAHHVFNVYFTLVSENPYDYDKRVQLAYLGLVEKCGTKEQCKTVIERMGDWLKTHDVDLTVHAVYLKLVNNRGKKEHWRGVIEETRKWLLTNAADNNMYITYLKLVKERGKEKQWNQVIGDTRRWLQTNQTDTTQVRVSFLRLVDSCGKKDHWQQAIKDTREWLQVNPTDCQVRAPYLGLVDRRGGEDQWKQAIKDTEDWLQANSADYQVRAPYLGFVDRRGEEDQWNRAIEDTREWLQANPADFQVRAPYLGVVDRKGKEEQWEKAIKDTEDWLQVHKDDSTVRVSYLGLVARHGSTDQLTTACRSTEAWLASHPQTRDRYLLSTYGNILLKLELYGQAEEQFRRALDISKGHVSARLGLAWSYYHQGRKEESHEEFMYILSKVTA